jgi:FlaA1/EpsC-like NDP-sugar epimerase
MPPLAMRFDGDVPGESLRFFAAASWFIALCYIAGNVFFRIYRTSWKFAGIVDAINLALAIGVVSIFLFAINVFLNPRHIPLTVNIIAPALMLIAMGGIKFWPRLWASRNPFGGYDAGVRTC